MGGEARVGPRRPAQVSCIYTRGSRVSLRGGTLGAPWCTWTPDPPWCTVPGAWCTSSPDPAWRVVQKATSTPWYSSSPDTPWCKVAGCGAPYHQMHSLSSQQVKVWKEQPWQRLQLEHMRPLAHRPYLHRGYCTIL